MSGGNLEVLRFQCLFPYAPVPRRQAEQREKSVQRTAVGDRRGGQIIDAFNAGKADDVETAVASLSAGLVMSALSEPYSVAFNKADKALYHVKQNGRNGYSFYREDVDSGSGEPLDVGKVVNGIRNSGNYQGALDVEYRQFVKLYEYISNLGRRFSHPFILILIALDCPVGEAPQMNELERDMFYMEQSIRQQFLIILLGTGIEGVKVAVDRIFRGYYKMNGSSAFTPSYFVGEMEGNEP